MWVLLILILGGFLIGYYFDIPYHLLGNKFIALIFLTVIESLTYSLSRDLVHREHADKMVFIRLVSSLVFGGFLIYFGEKSGLDLYLVALIPLGVGVALNLYKFLPK